MASLKPPPVETLIAGLIQWMRSEGCAPTRTRLMKFIYLVDLHWARRNDGQVVTGWRWYVDRFGPMATEFYRVTEDARTDGWLTWDNGSSDDEERSTSQACIYRSTRTIDDFDLLAVSHVKSIIRLIGDDTARLLRHVYGTELILDARPGDQLDFSAACKVDVRPLPSKKIAPKDMKRLRALLATMRAQHESIGREALNHREAMDQVFFDEMPKEDTLEDTGQFELLFDGSPDE